MQSTNWKVKQPHWDQTSFFQINRLPECVDVEAIIVNGEHFHDVDEHRDDKRETDQAWHDNAVEQQGQSDREHLQRAIPQIDVVHEEAAEELV